MVNAFFGLLHKDFTQDVIDKRPHLCARTTFDRRQEFQHRIFPAEPAQRRIKSIDFVRRIKPVWICGNPLAQFQNFILVKFRKFFMAIRAFHSGRLRQMIPVFILIPNHIIPLQRVQFATMRTRHTEFPLIASNIARINPALFAGSRRRTPETLFSGKSVRSLAHQVARVAKALAIFDPARHFIIQVYAHGNRT